MPLALTDEDVTLAVERTDSTTASFLKELIRRSVLESLHDDPALTTVTGAQLARALDDLLDAAQAVTRTLLGVGVDPADLPAGGALSAGPGPERCLDGLRPPGHGSGASSITAAEPSSAGRLPGPGSPAPPDAVCLRGWVDKVS